MSPSLDRQDSIPPAARTLKTGLLIPGTWPIYHDPKASGILCSQTLGRKVVCEVEVAAVPPPSSRSALGVLELHTCTPSTGTHSALLTTGHLQPTCALPLMRACLLAARGHGPAQHLGGGSSCVHVLASSSFTEIVEPRQRLEGGLTSGSPSLLSP